MTAPIICFDLDGTLVRSDGSIHPNDVEILKNERGVVWIPATGRMLHSVHNIFQRHGLFLDEPIPFPLILQNGASTYLPSEQLHEYLAFEPELQAHLIRLIEARPGLATFFSSVDELHIMHADPFAVQAANHYDFCIQAFTEASYSRRYGKVMCLSENSDLLAQIAEATRDLPLDRAFSMPTIFEVTPPGANKGAALKRLLPTIGMTDSTVYVVGDGGNDLTLFSAGDHSFTPLTSPPRDPGAGRARYRCQRRGDLGADHALRGR
ncbi:MAG TPA: HAD family hydrolase [Anaerolineaceae bacterium]|nr:HAD family hydrolase [Anaerolineaceae bacterium]